MYDSLFKSLSATESIYKWTTYTNWCQPTQIDQKGENRRLNIKIMICCSNDTFYTLNEINYYQVLNFGSFLVILELIFLIWSGKKSLFLGWNWSRLVIRGTMMDFSILAGLLQALKFIVDQASGNQRPLYKNLPAHLLP